MKTLNLTNIESSDIKFEVSRFPDGQKQVKIIKPIDIFHTDSFNIKYPIQIKARLNNFKDLELIICATKSLRELGVKYIHLYTPYFLGSRSDRKFEEGSNNYLKDVICPIINSLGVNSVTVMDPHSDVLEACLNNFKKVDNREVVRGAIPSFFTNEKGNVYEYFNTNCVLISPDAGANKKVFKVAEQINYTGDIITCSKSRDVNGKLTRTVVPLVESDSSGYSMQYIGNCDEKDFIIIDDICDGGATFINIAKELKHQEIKGKIYLIITHGIFSKGFKELNKYFDGIYCTNSYRDVADDEYGEKTNVKQLNVI